MTENRNDQYDAKLLALFLPFSEIVEDNDLVSGGGVYAFL
jgi:hypothetical protein